LFKNGQGQFQDIDYAIIAPAILVNRRKLAAFHRTKSNLNVKVTVRTNPGILIRETRCAAIETALNTYMKTLLPEKKNKVHPFGDASYDFKKSLEILILYLFIMP
jgi:hypothetical protein